MPANRIRGRTKKIKEMIVLILILSLASFLTFYPHLTYPYPLHVDEWFHIARAKQINLNSKIDWYYGGELKLGILRSWHLLLALIQKSFKLSITQWICLPTIFHILAICSVYFFVSKLLGKKEAFISSLLVALIPSNVTILGPVFLVPVNLSLIFIPLTLLFAFELLKIRKIYNCLILLSILTFILYAHPPTALVLLTILGFYFLLNLKNIEKVLKILLITALSILISLPNYSLEIQRRGPEVVQFDFKVHLKAISQLYGIVPTPFFLVGFYSLSKSKNEKIWSLLLTAIFLIGVIVLFEKFELNLLIPYQRAYIPLFLLMSIVASVGYSRLLGIKKYENFGMTLLLIFLIMTIYLAINRNLNTPYYHLIDDEDYENFLWIKQNSNKDVTVLLDPWKARAFVAIAERKIYSVMPFGPNEKYLKLIDATNKFFEQNCTNTTFLIENNISVVYSTLPCENDDLIRVKNNIYFIENFSQRK